MKTKHLFSFIIVALVVFATSCQPDEQVTPSPVGSWTCTEHSTQLAATTTYTVHINSVTSNANQVQIENLYNIGFGFKAIADVSGTTLTIANQTYNYNQLHGSGSMANANSMSLTYYMNDGNTIDTCTSSLARQ